MVHKKISAILLLVTLSIITACSKDSADSSKEAVTVRQEQEQVSSQLDQADPTNTTSTGTEQAVSAEEKIAGLGFSDVSKLDLDGYYCENIAAINANEVIAEISSDGAEQTKLVRINLKTGEKAIFQDTNGDEKISYYSLGQDDSGVVEWRTITNSANQSIYHTYKLDSHQQAVRVDDTQESPDGKWLADPNNEEKDEGIWGAERSSGVRKQWTTGINDDDPLWLPDSSGFIFLHDTGDNLGDGAGPRYELAKYDLGKHKVTILPYASGFWGNIEWLVPGESVLAYNGFDDGVGMKIVNLDTDKEYQIVDTSDFDYLWSSLNSVEHQLLVSDQGSFTIYGSSGEPLSVVPWPTGFDMYTNKHLSDPPTQTDEPVRQYYYTGGEQGGRFGPSSMRYSPDGKQLAYLLGAMGESSDDKVEGTRIALANHDGSETRLLTNDYVRISNIHWTPDGQSILALFTLEEDRKQYYIGTINL
ncbi:hypothetical protein DFQ01_106171 [Paenibacillus cellulosilyticus]|uniref:WD40 repeat protein n=1 Tax=Paenibacillus cellulosilyticus TaxID=375489 RepID=A0A2V2YV33_9BACL|nr:hypothetical protein [Paenibacillus cellulosilyticus]PWW04886.1 hypothetical protein DFQ01_106171 [Paenibacillus cellulosilyticus]QKS45992.1 hypothetical protein HUB94_17230 [Paenibacillus cellulosilyticus]